MSVTLPDLPYEKTALEPYISAETLSFHYGKHHAGYVNKLNKAIDGTSYEGMTLETIIRESHKQLDTAVFNNAAQVLNHTQYWESMTPGSTDKPGGELANAIERDFGSFDTLVERMKADAASLFGSGWVWLVSNEGTLSIEKTPNAETPMVLGADILLTIDVWEHAYYLDYQNDRPKYIDIFFDKLVNWARAEEAYTESLKSKAA